MSLLRSLPGFLSRAPAPDAGYEIALVILVSDEVHNFMRRLQVEIFERHGANLGLAASPHVTLKLGFRSKDIAPFERYFDRLAETVEPFEIRIDGFGFFDEGIIFLDVVPEPRLERLRRRILDELHAQFGIQPGPIEGDRYRFHATLAHGLAKEAFAAERRALEGREARYSFSAESLALFCRTGVEWVTYRKKRVPARGEAPGGTG